MTINDGKSMLEHDDLCSLRVSSSERMLAVVVVVVEGVKTTASLHQLSNSATLATTETRSKLPPHCSKERARGIRVKLA